LAKVKSEGGATRTWQGDDAGELPPLAVWAGCWLSFSSEVFCFYAQTRRCWRTYPQVCVPSSIASIFPPQRPPLAANSLRAMGRLAFAPNRPVARQQTLCQTLAARRGLFFPV